MFENTAAEYTYELDDRVLVASVSSWGADGPDSQMVGLIHAASILDDNGVTIEGWKIPKVFGHDGCWINPEHALRPPEDED